jgi:putative hydrolase of the HAD superfamily
VHKRTGIVTTHPSGALVRPRPNGVGSKERILTGVIRAVVFDLDGTLIDQRRASVLAFNSWIGAELPAPERLQVGDLRTVWLELATRHMAEYVRGECSYAEQQRRRMRAFLPIAGVRVRSQRESDSLMRAYLNRYERAWAPYPDVVSCLDHLARLSPAPILAVLTNGDPSQQQAKLDRVGLRHRFAHVLTSSELGLAKPDPRSFLAVCATLGTRPQDTVYVGDSADVDAIAATRAGLRGVWLDRQQAGLDCRPAVPINSLDELPAAVDRWVDTSTRGSRWLVPVSARMCRLRETFSRWGQRAMDGWASDPS